VAKGRIGDSDLPIITDKPETPLRPAVPCFLPALKDEASTL
jgi:hypothetical protein